MFKSTCINKVNLKYLAIHFLSLIVIVFSIFAFSTITSQAAVSNLSAEQLEEVNRVWGPASKPDQFPHYRGTNSDIDRYHYQVPGATHSRYDGRDYHGYTWHSVLLGPYLSGSYTTTQTVRSESSTTKYTGNFVIVTQGTGTVKMDSWIVGGTPSNPSMTSNTNPNGTVTYYYTGTGTTTYGSETSPTTPGTYRVTATVGTDKQKYSLSYTTHDDFTIYADASTPDFGVNKSKRAVVTKKLKMATETKLPAGITFKFDFTKDSLNGDASKKDEMPDIGSLSTTISEESQKSESGGITTYIVESNDFIAKFLADGAPATGKYIYKVTEANSVSGYNLENTDTKKENVIYSNTVYTVEIYVQNNGDTNVSVNTIVKKSDGEKVNPTPGAHGMVFENKFVRTFIGTEEDNVSLRVKKIIKNYFGDGDDNQIFNFSITITTPATVTDPNKAYSYKVVDSTGAVYNNQEGTLTSGAPLTFTMKDGCSLLVDGLEVGTIYSITEEGANNWTASYTINSGESETGKIGDGITISNKKILDQEVNEVVITNTYNSQTPTGILMSNFPFISMVVLGLGTLTLIAVTNSRKRANRA